MSPSFELEAAILARLKAHTPLTAFVGQRIYDKVSADAAFPYVSWGPEQIVSNDADCLRGFEVFIQLDVWSRTIGLKEVKQVAEEVRIALHDADLPLANNAFVSIEHRQTRPLPDPDGITNHAAVEFVAFVEQP